MRPIWKGEQLFISYIGIHVQLTGDEKNERQKKLKKNWGFDCKCDWCEQSDETVDSRALDDPRRKFILKNYKNNDKDEDVMEKCRQFLDMFGHSWSKEIQAITCIYFIKFEKQVLKKQNDFLNN